MHWQWLMRAFLWSAAIWLIGGVFAQVVVYRGEGDIATLRYLHTIFVTGFGSLTILLGAVLLGRWLWLTAGQWFGGGKGEP